MAKVNHSRHHNRKQHQQMNIQKAKRGKLMGWTLLVVLLVCAGFAIMGAFSGPQESKAISAAEFQYEKHPALGSPTAPVKMVEFADFKCPSCKEFDQRILPQIKKEFIDTGVVQLYFLNYPIISPNGDSRTAGVAALSVFHQNPTEFWKYYEALFSKQGDERTNWATPDTLVQIAKDANINVDYTKLKSDITSNAYAGEVNNDEAIGNKVGIKGTPTIYFNGKEVSEADTYNYDAIKQLIQKAKDAGN